MCASSIKSKIDPISLWRLHGCFFIKTYDSNVTSSHALTPMNSANVVSLMWYTVIKPLKTKMFIIPIFIRSFNFFNSLKDISVWTGLYERTLINAQLYSLLWRVTLIILHLKRKLYVDALIFQVTDTFLQAVFFIHWSFIVFSNLTAWNVH